MGNKNDKSKINYQTMIFDIFSTLKWHERIWKVFCFRFEYKYYINETNKYTIKWEEFEGIFLDEFDVDPDSENIDLNEWIIYNIFKKIFEYNNYEIRVYRVYMMFFPYCLHLNGAEGLNFIDLLFEKIIYNLELEMKIKLDRARNEALLKETLEKNEFKDEEEDIYSKAYNETDKKSKKTLNLPTSFKLGGFMNKFFSGKKIPNLNNINNILPDSVQVITKNNSKKQVISEQNVDKDMESDLIRVFENEFNSRKQEGFIRKISFEAYKEIMFVYFQNNIVLFLRAYNDIITDFKDFEYVDDNLVNNINAIKNQIKIDFDIFSTKNITKFFNNTYEKKLFGLRNNLRKDSDNIQLTFDDIYVYMKNNYYFYNCKNLYNQIRSETSIL